MRFPVSTFARLVLGLVLLAALPARADWTGDLTMSGAGRPPLSLGKIKLKAGKMRMEVTQPLAMTMLIDPGAKRMYRIDDLHKSYVETDLGAAGGDERRFPSCASGDIARCLTLQGYAKAGTGEANGQPCDLYEIERTAGAGRVKQTLYRPTKLKGVVFVRLEMGSGPSASRMDVTNLVEGKLDAALFVVPAGYEKRAPVAPGLPPGMTRQQLEQLLKKAPAPH